MCVYGVAVNCCGRANQLFDFTVRRRRATAAHICCRFCADCPQLVDKAKYSITSLTQPARATEAYCFHGIEIKK